LGPVGAAATGATAALTLAPLAPALEPATGFLLPATFGAERKIGRR
jgi:hypothetical protein